MILLVAQDHPTSGLIQAADHLINPLITHYLAMRRTPENAQIPHASARAIFRAAHSHVFITSPFLSEARAHACTPGFTAYAKLVSSVKVNSRYVTPSAPFLHPGQREWRYLTGYLER
jgi:hypothetical protein